jgi:hypothetical protein
MLLTVFGISSPDLSEIIKKTAASLMLRYCLKEWHPYGTALSLIRATFSWNGTLMELLGAS